MIWCRSTNILQQIEICFLTLATQHYSTRCVFVVSLTDHTDISEEQSAIFDDIRLHCFYQALHVLRQS